MKVCSVCLIKRDESEFSPQNTKDGLCTQCKNCSLVRCRLWVENISPVPNPIIRLIVRSQDI